jgi:hypothetical protein
MTTPACHHLFQCFIAPSCSLTIAYPLRARVPSAGTTTISARYQQLTPIQYDTSTSSKPKIRARFGHVTASVQYFPLPGDTSIGRIVGSRRPKLNLHPNTSSSTSQQQSARGSISLSSRPHKSTLSAHAAYCLAYRDWCERLNPVHLQANGSHPTNETFAKDIKTQLDE